MTAGGEGVLVVVVAGRNRLGGSEETGGGDNNKIGDGFGGGVGRGIERGLGRRGGVSGSERVKWSGMGWGGAEDGCVLNLDRRRAGNTAGRDKVVAKT